jgi:hypothetical protein
MATKYEVLASLVQREHDNWAYMSQDDGDGNHHVIIGILRTIHDYENDPRPGGPNNPIDWEAAVEEIYDRIAHAFNITEFDEGDAETAPPSEGSDLESEPRVQDVHGVDGPEGSASDADPSRGVDSTHTLLDGVSTADPIELDIPS